VIDGMELLVVDPDTRRLRRPGELGEVWLRGASVAQGYWGRRDEEQPEFRATLSAPDEAERHPGPFLRTGDIGVVDDGELYVAGRIKDLMFVRGRNFHPEDIEATVATAHPSLRPGGSAVFSIDDGDEERVVVVQEVVTRGLDREAVIAAIRHAVAVTHGLELYAVVLIRPRTITKTTNGKIQRHAARGTFLGGEFPGTVAVWRHGPGRRGHSGRTAAPQMVEAP
jgi:acyl-CoA synthetase (AMP-forming)/AMP-acid ligase II